jgi:16S rRNA (uracil1498-N3)-methyltransferase
MQLFHITDREIHGDRIIIQGPDLFHIRKVLRKKPGDILSFTDSRFVYQARIDTIDARSLTTGRVLAKAPLNPAAPAEIHLYIAQIQFSCLETILDQATQLGVRSVTFMRTEQSQNHPVKEEKFKRWQRIIREAAKQSFNPRPPVLEEKIIPFSSALKEKSPLLLLHPYAEEGLKQVLANNKKSAWHILTGPEAGFTEKEISLALSSGARAARISSPVLRTETAVTAAISSILYHYQ